MQMFDDIFRELILCNINHIIDRSEMMNRFQKIVHQNSVSRIKSIRFKDLPCLIFGNTASFNMIRIVCHPDLKLMIETSGQLQFFLFTKYLKDVVIRNLPHNYIRRFADIISNLLYATFGEFFTLGNFCNRSGRKTKLGRQFRLSYPLFFQYFFKTFI